MRQTKAICHISSSIGAFHHGAAWCATIATGGRGRRPPDGAAGQKPPPVSVGPYGARIVNLLRAGLESLPAPPAWG